MNKIPLKLRQDLENDPFYKKCVLTGFTRFKIDFHHCFIYQGRQISEKWCILPIWERKHGASGDKDSVHNCKMTKEWVELIALKRARPEVFEKYKKANLEQRKKYLMKKYGR